MSMEEHLMEVSPRVLARIGGALYLIMIVLGALGEVFVRGRIVVWGCYGHSRQPQVDGVSVALRYRFRALPGHLRCCLGTDHLCLNEAG